MYLIFRTLGRETGKNLFSWKCCNIHMMSCFICWIRGHDNANIFLQWQSHLTSFKERFRSNLKQRPHTFRLELTSVGKLLRRRCSTASSRERRVKLSTPHWTKNSQSHLVGFLKCVFNAVDLSVFFSRTHFDWILGHYSKPKINRKRSQNMSFWQDMYTWLQKFHKVRIHFLQITWFGSFFKQDVT